MMGGGEIQKMSHKMGDLVCGGIGAKWGGGRGGGRDRRCGNGTVTTAQQIWQYGVVK